MSYLGAFLLEQGVITQEQLEEGLRFQREHNRRLGQLAVERGLLPPEAVEGICRAQRNCACLFGEMAVRRGALSRRALDEALFFQKVEHTYLGEALLLLGHISPEQYTELLGRYYALRDSRRISPRYLHEFFAENRALDCLVTALCRTLERLAGQSLTVSGVGCPFALEAFPLRVRLEGVLSPDRSLVAVVGLSEELAAELGRPSAMDGAGAEACYAMVGRFFQELLEERGLILSGERLCPGGGLDLADRDCVFVLGQTATGRAGLALWLAEVLP